MTFETHVLFARIYRRFSSLCIKHGNADGVLVVKTEICWVKGLLWKQRLANRCLDLCSR